MISQVPTLDPSLYAGHSFRRGGASALFSAGVSDSWIQIRNRWKSECFRQYIQLSVKERLAPTLALQRF